MWYLFVSGRFSGWSFSDLQKKTFIIKWALGIIWMIYFVIYVYYQLLFQYFLHCTAQVSPNYWHLLLMCCRIPLDLHNSKMSSQTELLILLWSMMTLCAHLVRLCQLHGFVWLCELSIDDFMLLLYILFWLYYCVCIFVFIV